MTTTNNFSIKRTYLLMQRTIANHGKSVLLALVGILGISLIFFTLTGLSGAFDSYRYRIENDTGRFLRDFFLPYYFFGLLLFGAVVVGMAFPDFRRKGKTISYLTLPANTAEKFLSMFLLTTIGFVLVYTVGFYIFNITAIFIGKLLGGIDFKLIRYTAVDFIEVAKIFFLLHAFFFLGATIFKKVPVLFSGILLSLLVMVTTLVFPLIVDLFFGSGSYTQMDDLAFKIQLPGINSDFAMNWLNYFMAYVAAPVLWLIAFFKLKEKEV